MIIERVIFKDDLEKFYNHDLTLSDIIDRSWTEKTIKLGEGFKIIKIEIPEMEENK
jgi:hypothetical protein